MLKAAVVEEDLVYRKYTKELLLRWANKKTKIELSGFANGDEFLKHSVHILEYDIIFIDVSQRQPNGIQTAERLRDMGYPNVLILMSAVNDWACDGYRVNAYRYYIKPLGEEQIRECMDYVLNQKVSDYFQYTYRRATEKIAFREIVCFESMQHYIDIHTLHDTIHIKGVLKEIQEQCPAYFIRCQRSYLVNKHYITGRVGKRLKLKTGKIVDISPKYTEIIEEAMRD